MAAWTAHPLAIDSSWFSVRETSSMLKKDRNNYFIIGIRVAPPTISTLWISPTCMSASATAMDSICSIPSRRGLAS